MVISSSFLCIPSFKMRFGRPNPCVRVIIGIVVVKISQRRRSLWWMLWLTCCSSVKCIQGKPVRGCPRNPIDETKLEAWTWQPFYIINSEWLKPDQCRDFLHFYRLLNIFIFPKTTNTVHVGDPAAGRANTTHRSHVNVASLTAKKVWAVRRCFKQCGNWWRWLGTSSPDRLFENGLFLHGGTLADRAFSTLNV